MEKKVTVRAIPAGHHQVRYAAQRPWSSDTVTVTVKDNAKPPFTTPSTDTGHQVKHIYQHQEITPAELAELKADPHIVVTELAADLKRA